MKRHAIRGDSAVRIAASVEEAIRTGGFRPDDSLPPIRQLAASLRVSPVTVASAYRHLHARGLVIAGGRRGTRIRPNPPTAAVSRALAPIPEGMVDLATGNPDPALLPPVEQALRSLTLAPSLYGEAPLLQPLVSFAAGEFAADGIPAGAVAILSGALDAIERLLHEHLRAGDRVGVEDPALPALLDLIGACGVTTLPMPVDAEGPRPDGFEEALSRGARAVIVTPRAQNPTGAAMSATRAAGLARLLRGRDEVLVIENDPAGPISGVAAVTLCAGSHPRWAVVRSVSKFLGPDLRIACVAGDALTMARVQGRHALGMRWVSRILQQLALSLWSDPSSGRRLARAADTYAVRRAALVDALAAHGVAADARSGFNVWIPVRDETATVQWLAQRGWAVAAGERFRIRSGPGIRVTTSALRAEEAQRFAAACAEASRPAAAASA